MRLVDADALLANRQILRGEDVIGIRDYVTVVEIENAPTIEPERKTEWIPCSERLPEMGQPVIDDFISLNWLSYASDGIEWVFPRNVTAWMPLPEPYKGEQPCN